MQLGLEGKTAIITGGSKGIGLAIKKSLEKEGVRVFSLSRSEGLDLTDKYNLGTAGSFTKYEILINNVGGCGTSNDNDLIMLKNYTTMEKMISSYLMTKREWGRVITISSIFGKEKGYNPGFTAAKSAQIAYMKSLAGKYEGITFNTICPGCINTKQEIELFADQHNMTLGEPEDVANIVAFLCSDKAKHINGACITVDGGDSHAY